MTEQGVYIEGTDAYDFHNAMAEMVERREPFTILAGDGRPLARVEPIPPAMATVRADDLRALLDAADLDCLSTDDLPALEERIERLSAAAGPEPVRAIEEPVTLEDLVVARRVEMKGDCSLWNDGDLGVVLGPHMPASVRVRIHRNGMIVSARPENIARLARLP